MIWGTHNWKNFSKISFTLKVSIFHYNLMQNEKCRIKCISVDAFELLIIQKILSFEWKGIFEKFFQLWVPQIICYNNI